MTDGTMATPPGDCREWTGPTNNGGYGIVRSILVHRTVYEVMVGPIPEGLEVDHLCFNRRCANPDHLEAVTSRENVRRANSRNTQMRCIRGHDAWVLRPNGNRRCSICARARDKGRVRNRSKAAA